MSGQRLRLVREYGLTAGTLGSTAGQTIMVALLPVLLASYTDSALSIGFVVGGEGVFAILVPYWIGALSDALPHRWARRFGRRTMFLSLMAPLMAAALAAVPFLKTYWLLALAAFLFFAGLHGYLTPLWAVMVDVVPDERRGRVHGVRGALHAAGLGYGLVAGGLLFSLWQPLPFLLAGALVLAATVLTVMAIPAGAAAGGHEALAAPRASRAGGRSGGAAAREARPAWRGLFEEPALGWFLLANALWTGAVDGIRPYVFLFAVTVLGLSVATTSLLLLLLVAGIGMGAVLVGHLGDRYGRSHLLGAGALLTGLALSMGYFVQDVTGALTLLATSGVAAAALIALPYPIFTSLVGDRAVGGYTGLYILSLGLARVIAPVVIGAMIDVGGLLIADSDGYRLMWPTAGALALLGVGALRKSMAARKRSIARP
ncbi:MAG: MFS transporter [Gemmatimonadetes bacterium]|nr:MFS transporter [Gemmatimonadota bacterium]